MVVYEGKQQAGGQFCHTQAEGAGNLEGQGQHTEGVGK